MLYSQLTEGKPVVTVPCDVSDVLKIYCISSNLILAQWGQNKMATILADNIFICIFLNENFWISYQISLKYVHWGLIC